MPRMQSLFCDFGISIYLDEDVPCLVNEWNEFLPSDQFRRYILKLLAIYQQVRQSQDHLTLLADTRNLSLISPADTKWVASEINPRYVELGCHYEAFIVPENEYGKFSIDSYIRHSTSMGPMITRKFTNIAKAKSWLKAVNSVVPRSPTFNPNLDRTLPSNQNLG